MSVVKSHSLSIGIVGLPNAGKSTLFNSITKSSVPAENYPFCTIDKNIGVVQVPDPRLDALESFYKAEKKVPALIKFVDIAGLVKGASQGEGLGNQFLSHIREVDAIMYVIRSFSSEQIVHVYERINPIDDLRIVQAELILKDLESVEKKLGEIKKKARVSSDKAVELQVNLLERLMEWLSSERPAIEMELTAEERAIVKELWLLTFKPRIYVMNIREGMDEDQRNRWIEELKSFIPAGDEQYITQLDVKMLGDMMNMNDDEKKEYIELVGAEPVSFEQLIRKGFERLELITFYTGSKTEVNAWSVKEGVSVKEAAGVIHSDLSDNFITADVIAVEELVQAGGFQPAKEKGLVKNQGREYLVKDGDYIIVYTTNSK